MKASKRPWTRAEKALFVAPFLIALGIGSLQFAPYLKSREPDPPKILTITPKYSLRCLRISGNGRVVAATGYQSTPRTSTNVDSRHAQNGMTFLWDTQSLDPIGVVEPSLIPGLQDYRAWSAVGIALSPDGQRLGFSRYKRSYYVLLDLKTHRVIWKANIRGIQADFSPDGKRIAINGVGRAVILDAATGKILKSWKSSSDWYYMLVLWSPDGQILASINEIEGKTDKSMGSRAGKIELRSTKGEKLRELGNNSTSAFRFSPDGQEIVAVETFKSKVVAHATRISCYEVSTGNLKWVQDEHPNYRFTEAIFSPDGKIVLVQSISQILVLDGQSGKLIRNLDMPKTDYVQSFPHSLAFSPDGKRLFARGDGSVLVWDLNL